MAYKISPEEKHVLGQRDGITAPPGYKVPKKFGEPIEIQVGKRGEGKSFTALKEIWKQMGGKEAVPISTVIPDTYDLQPRSWTKTDGIKSTIPPMIPVQSPPSIFPNPVKPVQEPEEKKTIQKKIVKEPKKPEKKDRWEALEILPPKPKENAGDE